MATRTTFLGSFSFVADEVEAGDSYSISGEDVDDYLNWAVGLLGDFYDTGEKSATDSLVTFIVTPRVDTTATGLELYSLAGASVDGQKPQLGFAAIPEPATVGWIMGFVVVAVLVGHRRLRR